MTDNSPRTAIVTGASSGVGAATAVALGAAGYRVAIVARRHERLQELAASIGGAGGEVFPIAADLRTAAAAERAMRESLSALGSVDVMVHCLGANVAQRRLSELSAASWDSLLSTNLSAIFYCVRAVLPHMRGRGGGRIVSISSIAGAQPSGLSGAAYSASKAGLNALSTCINLEEGPNGIQSCIIAPGDINTELLDFRPQPPPQEARGAMLQPADVAALVLDVLQSPPHVWVEYITVKPAM
jgi:NAD(P)-dependent dehydrogenase (short-subunit alcohol dehydrogenase family)